MARSLFQDRRPRGSPGELLERVGREVVAGRVLEDLLELGEEFLQARPRQSSVSSLTPAFFFASEPCSNFAGVDPWTIFENIWMKRRNAS